MGTEPAVAPFVYCNATGRGPVPAAAAFLSMGDRPLDGSPCRSNRWCGVDLAPTRWRGVSDALLRQPVRKSGFVRNGPGADDLQPTVSVAAPGHRLPLQNRHGSLPERNLIDDFQAVPLEGHEFPGVVRKDPHGANGQGRQDLYADTVLSLFAL